MTRAANKKHTAWFDELFDGGLKIPSKTPGEISNNIMVMMLSGPPGTGKSTFALEFCYRLATNKLNSHPLRSVYLSTEGHPPWLIQHVRQDFGWDEEGSALGEESIDNLVDVRSFKTVEDAERLTGSSRDREGMFRVFMNSLAKASDKLQPLKSNEVRPVDWENRDIVVFDNLNTIEMHEQEWVTFLKALSTKGPRLVLIMLDSSSGDLAGRKWEYLSDIVIRLERGYSDGYMTRTMEIIKARYQHHVNGRQQFKILEASKIRTRVPIREHPYRVQGGIFLYPSMHFVLSRHKYSRESDSNRFLATPFPHLDRLLTGKGFPVGRCVALTGQRGTHKSRVAYAQLLHTLQTDKHSLGILISLGDDEQTTERILQSSQKLISGKKQSGDDVHALISAGRLEIAYFPPGFITPEEFFHRILVSVARCQAKSEKDSVLLVFNSLDILSSHFPLCAKHSIFIPALIELLSFRGVTSFFVATDDVHPYGVPQDEHSGLLSMADPILRFERLPADSDAHTNWYRESPSGQNSFPQSIVRMHVERFAAGTSAGLDADLLLLPAKHSLARELGRSDGGLFVEAPRQI